jgi:hypothetical protein
LVSFAPGLPVVSVGSGVVVSTGVSVPLPVISGIESGSSSTGAPLPVWAASMRATAAFPALRWRARIEAAGLSGRGWSIAGARHPTPVKTAIT